jgi:hypothetical protein
MLRLKLRSMVTEKKSMKQLVNSDLNQKGRSQDGMRDIY